MGDAATRVSASQLASASQGHPRSMARLPLGHVAGAVGPAAGQSPRASAAERVDRRALVCLTRERGRRDASGTRGDGRPSAGWRAHPLPRLAGRPWACAAGRPRARPGAYRLGLARPSRAVSRPATRSSSPDLRGHGASDAPVEGYELERLALDVLTVMAGQGWGEAVGGPGGGGRGPRTRGHAGGRDGAPGAGLGGRHRARRRLAGRTMQEATRMLPMQLVEAMAEPPEVMASMDAWLADRRDFDPSTWDADQEAGGALAGRREARRARRAS